MKSRLYILLLFFLIFATPSKSVAQADTTGIGELRAKGDSYFDNDFAAYENLMKQVVSKYLTIQAWEDIALTYQDLGISAYYNGLWEEMGYYLQKALTVTREETYDFSEKRIYEIGQNYAVYLYLKSDYHKSLATSVESLNRYRQYLERTGNAEEEAMLSSAYSNIGMTYRQIGNYKEAKEYISLAIQLTPDSEHLAIAEYYNNLGVNYSDLKDYDNALFSFNKALAIINQHQLDAPSLQFFIHNNIAYYLHPVNKSLADKSWKKATVLVQNARQENAINNTRGKMLLFEQNPQAAISYFEKALDSRIETSGEKHPDVALVYLNIGDSYAALNDYEAALSHYHNAMNSLIINASFDQLAALPDSWDGVLNESILLQTLQKKGNIFYKKYSQGQNQQDVEWAFQHLEKAAELLENLRRSFRSEDARIQLQENTGGLFEDLLAVAYELHQLTQNDAYLEKAFQFVEQNKAVSLLEALQDADARQFAGIPDTLLAFEKQLKLDIVFYTDLYNEAIQYEDTVGQEEASLKLVNLNEQYDQLIQQLEKSYPSYFDLKYNTHKITIAEVQDYLYNDGHAVIEYFKGDKNWYTFAISKNQVFFNQSLVPSDAEATFQTFRQAASDFEFIRDSLEIAIENYTTSGLQLYDWLLKQPLTQLQNPSKITIVPDGEWAYLPFEALLTEAVTGRKMFNTLPYLLLSTEVAYAYSTTLQQGNTNSPKKVKYGGFAATYDNTSPTLYALRAGEATIPGAEKSVATVSQFTNGTAWIGEEASESQFKAKANQYGILHLAMHGILDDKNPMYSHLLFTDTPDTLNDNQLNALEIYNMQLNANLAVLSACNTGYGTLRKGEGVISLSRAFAYAGCPSTIMSLWSVPDAATSEIVIDFFKNITNDPTLLKSEALRQAKLNYLQDKDAFLSHPIFWAGFTPVGDMSPLNIHKVNYWKYVLGIAFLVFGLGIYLFFKKR